MRQYLKIYMMGSLLALGIVCSPGCATKALDPANLDDVTWNRYSGIGLCLNDDKENVDCRINDIMIPENDLQNLIDKIFTQCNK